MPKIGISQIKQIIIRMKLFQKADFCLADFKVVLAIRTPFLIDYIGEHY